MTNIDRRALLLGRAQPASGEGSGAKPVRFPIESAPACQLAGGLIQRWMQTYLDELDFTEPETMRMIAKAGFRNEHEFLAALSARMLIDGIMTNSKYRALWHDTAHDIMVGYPDHKARAAVRAAKQDQPDLPFASLRGGKHA